MLDSLACEQDGGMSLLMSALVPDFEWRCGTADINLTAQGPLSAPTIDGRALLFKATLSSPHLRYPVTGLAADIRVSVCAPADLVWFGGGFQSSVCYKT